MCIQGLETNRLSFLGQPSQVATDGGSCSILGMGLREHENPSVPPSAQC